MLERQFKQGFESKHFLNSPHACMYVCAHMQENACIISTLNMRILYNLNPKQENAAGSTSRAFSSNKLSRSAFGLSQVYTLIIIQ
jgi:hypothetical protein